MKAIEIKNANFAYDRDPVLRELNLTLMNKEKITIIGGNGVGKTTLIKIIIGELKLKSGQIKIFEEDLNINSLKKIGYVPQSQKENLYTFLEKYADYPLRDLSGGLRQRVVITRALMNNPEILIFDEPTSGVDENSKRQFAKTIEDLNNNFDVSIILITHELDWVKNNLQMDKFYELKKGGLELVTV